MKMPTEAGEVAENIVHAHQPTRLLTFDEARLLTTRFMGTPEEVGYQLHANVAESIQRQSLNI